MISVLPFPRILVPRLQLPQALQMAIQTSRLRANEKLTKFYSTVASGNNQPAGTMGYLQHGVSETDLTTYTFAAANLGVAAGDRYIAVGVLGRAAAARTISSLTVGGVAATVVAQQTIDDGGPDDISGIAIAAVPTGTTGDVVITMSGVMLRICYAAWRLTGMVSPTAHATSQVGPIADPVFSLNVPTNGILIAMSSQQTGLSPTCTWVNATERFDDATLTDGFSGADASIPAGATPQSVTANWSAGAIGIGTAASWQLNP
jgi:hypothetical protein